MFYIIGTPIGNIKDISLRAVRTIFSLDYLLTEDTRTAGTLLIRLKKLFSQFENAVNPKLISYYQDVEMEKLPLIIKLVKEGKKLGLISQAGMPLISDPGYLLIKSIIQEKLDFTVIPGPTAFVTALAHSGFKGDNIFFFGFYPKKESQVKKMNEKIGQVIKIFDYLTVVFYESPLRIKKTITLIKDRFPQAKIVIARELTKRYEEIIRNQSITPQIFPLKGEIIVLVNFKKSKKYTLKVSYP